MMTSKMIRRAIGPAVVVLITGLIAIGGAAQAQAPGKFTRVSAKEFAKDPQKVAALRKAVTAMRAASTATPTTPAYRGSLEYWSATHGYFGQGENASGTAADFKAGAPVRCGVLSGSQKQDCLRYYNHVKDFPVPNDGITSGVWGTCQHSDDTDNLHFLTWHRMYLHFFERVMRKHSGDPNLALPYWEYSAEKGPGGRGIALPALVRGTATGPMFDEFRTPGLNTNATAIPANMGSAVQAFKQTDLTNFSLQLEQQPHGLMHCGTGFSCRAPDMGIVPVAGLDPVFYMHHANIDRLWQCWLLRQSGGQAITLAWAKANLGMDDAWFSKTFNFVDENGAAVTMSVQELFQPGVIDSQYDKQTDCVPARAVRQAAAAPQAVPSMSSSSAVQLKDKPVSVPLKPTAPDPAAKAEGLRAQPGRTVLIIENITIQGQPAALYDIYVHSRRTPSKAAYVATINYFGVLGPRHGGHGQEAATAPRTIKRLVYDVTDELAQLGLSGQNASDIAVRFTPNSGTLQPAAAAPNAGTVTVGSVRLQTQ